VPHPDLSHVYIESMLCKIVLDVLKGVQVPLLDILSLLELLFLLECS
jgi:hypothetical protein